MKNNKNTKTPAKEQLNQDVKVIETFTNELTQPKQSKPRRRNKKKVEPIKEVVIEPIAQPKQQNLIVKYWNKFVLWLNS
jgi:hypothetical protein